MKSQYQCEPFLHVNASLALSPSLHVAFRTLTMLSSSGGYYYFFLNVEVKCINLVHFEHNMNTGRPLEPPLLSSSTILLFVKLTHHFHTLKTMSVQNRMFLYFKCYSHHFHKNAHNKTNTLKKHTIALTRMHDLTVLAPLSKLEYIQYINV